jgi:DNA-binding NarL/FixJ family response regulator
MVCLLLLRQKMEEQLLQIIVQDAASLKPDIILLDLSMPEMNGLDALEDFETGAFEVIKVIILS